MKIGANYTEAKTEFIVWAPNSPEVTLVLPEMNQVLKMDKTNNGYRRLAVKDIKPNTRYMFRLKDKERPDPASHSQPDGVFSSSAVVNHSSFLWKDDNWPGAILENMIIYELHVGTFSREGTFKGVYSRAADLSEMGITAIELMPVSQFSGDRNWGYDAVYPFAVQNSYGGPDELKRLVEEFHSKGIAVILDVVYNHLGPEGNFFGDFGPYFLATRQTPWGASMNFDGLASSNVRDYFFENAIYWFENYHVDGLRLDAVFAILDNSKKHFLKELSEKVGAFSKKTSRRISLIAENDSVNPEIIKSRKVGGFGLDGLWHDNLHHSVHAILTGERNWYYSSFGSLGKIIEALCQSCAEQRSLPAKQPLVICSSRQFLPSRLVVFSQNHDQIGNRPTGDRLVKTAGFEAAKLAAGIILLSPFTPLLFMGEEYAERAPFLFFTDYSNKALGEKVESGRKRELKKNGWKTQPNTSPQDPTTFSSSKIDWDQRSHAQGKQMLGYYRELIDFRKRLHCDSRRLNKEKFFAFDEKSLLVIQKDSDFVTLANFSPLQQEYQFLVNRGQYVKVLDSADTRWGGPGSILASKIEFGDSVNVRPSSFAVYWKSKSEDQ